MRRDVLVNYSANGFDYLGSLYKMALIQLSQVKDGSMGCDRRKSHV